jgi:hypothetical protein
VIVSALVVVVFAAWVLTPILLINYPTAFAAIPVLRDVIADTAISEPRAPTSPVTERKSEEARDLVIEPRPESQNPDNATAAAEPVPLPTEQQNPPGPTLASASAIPAPPENDPVASVASAGLMPWPTPEPQTAPTGDAELGAAPDSPPVDFGPVPLPPRRPDASSLAQLGTPLPRPRPTETPATEAEKTIPDAERQLFDRLSAPN